MIQKNDMEQYVTVADVLQTVNEFQEAFYQQLAYRLSVMHSNSSETQNNYNSMKNHLKIKNLVLDSKQHWNISNLNSEKDHQLIQQDWESMMLKMTLGIHEMLDLFMNIDKTKQLEGTAQEALIRWKRILGILQKKYQQIILTHYNK